MTAVAAKMKLDRDQERAVADCVDLENRIVAVTGMAGTGKTTIIRDVATDLVTRGLTVFIAAPTGKAARRIREATGFDAQTIHRLLEFPRPDEFDEKTGKALTMSFPRRNRERPLPPSVVLVDEYAMVPWDLHGAIVNALGPGSYIRIFGDEAQLAPIEPVKRTKRASPFITTIKNCPSHALERVYRQGEGSAVLQAAIRVRDGKMPYHTDTAAILQTDDPLRALNALLDSRKLQGFETLESQLIVPVRRGPLGTHSLNSLLQARFNPNPPVAITLPRRRSEEEYTVRVAVGDKVVCTENTYDLRDWSERYEEWKEGRPVSASHIPTPSNKQMLNGETGVIRKIDYDGALEIDFGDRVVEVPCAVQEFYARRGKVVPVDYRKAIDLAYALTTHKCQGSEFENVCYLMGGSTWFNLSRRNLYTGITRAKKSFTVLTDQRSLLRSLSNKE